MNPGSFVLGIDVEAVQTSESLPNCHFQVMDATGQWSFAEKFDFIHVRMLGDLNDRAQLFGSIYDNLSPGGWVEISEWVMLLQSPDHSTDNTAFNRWNCHLRDGEQAFEASNLYFTNSGNRSKSVWKNRVLPPRLQTRLEWSRLQSSSD